MDATLIAAIIAAFGSLLVAVISLLTSIITTRQNSKINKEIENLRFEGAERSNTLERMNERFKKRVDALDQSCFAIQKFRDELLLLLNATHDSLDLDIAGENVELSRSLLFETYEKVHVDLNNYEMDLLHKAKNLSLKTRNMLLEKDFDGIYVSGMTEETRNSISRVRDQLFEIQSILRDSKLNVFVDNIKLLGK